MKSIRWLAAMILVLGWSGRVRAEEDLRSADHVELAGAAKWAILKGNVVLLKALLEAGLQIDEVLDVEFQQTALHTSALANQPVVVKFLVARGASLELYDKHGERPIDWAVEKKETEVCELLRKPAEKERMIGEFALPMLDELFDGVDSEKVRCVSVNGEDPPKELMAYFQRRWPGCLPYSQKKDEHALFSEITLKATGEGVFEWRHREATGQGLSGGGTYGKISKLYGYWVKSEDGSWDE